MALAARLSALFFYLASHHWKAETWEYEVIATNVLREHSFSIPYHNTVYRALTVPVFPLICAGLHWLSGAGQTGFYVYHLCTSLAVLVVTYYLAEEWFGHWTAVAAVFWSALEPGVIVYQSYKVDVLPLAMLLLVGGAYAYLELERRPDLGRAGVAGILTGLGFLTRPDIIALLVLPLIWVLRAKERRRALRLSVLAFAIAAAVAMPWAVRNRLVLGRWIFVNTFSGEAFWRGNNALSTGTTMSLDERSQLEAAPAEFRARIYGLDEVGQGREFRAEAMRFITSEPTMFIRRFFERFFYFFWFTPNYAARVYYGWLPGGAAGVYKALWALTLIPFFYGIKMSLRGTDRTRGAASTLLIVMFVVALIHSIYYVEGRHRILVMPLILIFASHGLEGLFKRDGPA